MAIQNLTLYDFIVDLTPGITAVFVLAPLAWSESLVQQALFGSPFKFGISLLVFGYVLGRLLHAISGSKPVEIFRDSFDRLYLGVYTTVFSNRLRPFVTDSRLLGYTAKYFDGGTNATPFEKRIEGIAETESQRICSRACDEYLVFQWDSPGTKRFKHFGESLLYGERVLYRKYEMLTTFFGNLAFLFSLCTVAYAVYVFGVPSFRYPIDSFPYESVWTANTSEPYPYRWSVPFFLALSSLCHTQRLKFEHRKHRAFVDDLYVVLAENDSLDLTKSGE